MDGPLADNFLSIARAKQRIARALVRHGGFGSLYDFQRRESTSISVRTQPLAGGNDSAMISDSGASVSSQPPTCRSLTLCRVESIGSDETLYNPCPGSLSRRHPLLAEIASSLRQVGHVAAGHVEHPRPRLRVASSGDSRVDPTRAQPVDGPRGARGVLQEIEAVREMHRGVEVGIEGEVALKVGSEGPSARRGHRGRHGCARNAAAKLCGCRRDEARRLHHPLRLRTNRTTRSGPSNTCTSPR